MAETKPSGSTEQPRQERIHGASEIEDAIMKAINSSSNNRNHRNSGDRRPTAEE